MSEIIGDDKGMGIPLPFLPKVLRNVSFIHTLCNFVRSNLFCLVIAHFMKATFDPKPINVPVGLSDTPSQVQSLIECCHIIQASRIPTTTGLDMAAHIQGTCHQGDPRFDGRGRQCTAMAMTALAYHSVKNVTGWDAKDVDSLLELGDKVFMEASKAHSHVTTLLPSDVSQTLTIDKYRIDFIVHQSHSGVLCNGADEKDLDLDNLQHVLSEIEDTGIITFGQVFSSYAIAIIKHCNLYYVFDSHSRDRYGMCQVDGKASVTKHKCLKDVAIFIYRLSLSVGMTCNCFFDIVNVSVTLHSLYRYEDSFNDEDEIPLLLLLQKEQTSTCYREDSDSDDMPLASLKRQSKTNDDSFPYDSFDEFEDFGDDDYVPSKRELARCSSASSEQSVEEMSTSISTPITNSGYQVYQDYHSHVLALKIDAFYQDELYRCYFRESTDCIGAKEQEEQRKSRKRKRNTPEWKINQRKRLRNMGQEYVMRSGKVKRKRLMKSGCGDNCRAKCHSKITEAERSIIFHSFWQTGCLAKQRDYICRVVERQEKKITKTKSNSRRSNTYVYNLEVHSKTIKVCKKMFMDTLDINDTVVATSIRNSSDIGISGIDQRGRHVQRGKIEEKEQVRKHIDSFSRVESHYARKDSTREYLEGSLSLQKLYDMYVSKRASEGCISPVSENTYRSIFNKEFNISFHKRMKDQCDVCAGYKNGKIDIEDYDQHIQLKEDSRNYKDQIKSSLKSSPSTAAAVFDLEEVLSTPSSMESCLYYKRKLNTYNLTVYDYRDGQGFCYLWNETEAQRGSNEIASCVYSYLERLQGSVKKVVLFSDSCGGQNRNKNFLSMLWLAMQRFEFDSIEHVFFVSGHSQNEGDSMHSVIERRSRNIPVYTPAQWAQLIRSAKRKHPMYIVEEFDRSNFYNFKSVADSLTNFQIDSEREKIKWLKVKRFHLSSSEPHIVKVYYDYSEDQFQTLNLTQKLRISHPAPNEKSIHLRQVTKKSYPLKKDKYQDLITLCEKGIIPRPHHEYYRNLPHEI